MFKSESLVWLVPKAFKCLNHCHCKGPAIVMMK